MEYGEGIENPRWRPWGTLILKLVLFLCWDIHCIHVSTGLVPEPGKDLRLFCQCKGGHF
jgi:hypothetical protein